MAGVLLHEASPADERWSIALAAAAFTRRAAEPIRHDPAVAAAYSAAAALSRYGLIDPPVSTSNPILDRPAGPRSTRSSITDALRAATEIHQELARTTAAAGAPAITVYETRAVAAALAAANRAAAAAVIGSVDHAAAGAMAKAHGLTRGLVDGLVPDPFGRELLTRQAARLHDSISAHEKSCEQASLAVWHQLLNVNGLSADLLAIQAGRLAGRAVIRPVHYAVLEHRVTERLTGRPFIARTADLEPLRVALRGGADTALELSRTALTIDAVVRTPPAPAAVTRAPSPTARPEAPPVRRADTAPSR